MSFKISKKSLEEFYKVKNRKFVNAQMLGVMFNTRDEIARELLPPPLEPVPGAGGLIFIAEYPETNLGPGYNEAALFLKCKYDGEEGTYCLSMPITDETRMHNGRDVFGYPKKMAKIFLEKNGNKAHAWVERNGIRFIEIKAQFNSEINQLPPTGPNFLFKATPKIDLTPGFDGDVLLVRQETKITVKKLELGMGEVKLLPSETDPWHEIEMENSNTLMSFFLTSDNEMLPGKVMREVNGDAFLPFYFKMTDFVVPRKEL